MNLSSLLFPLLCLLVAIPKYQDPLRQHYDAAEAHRRAGNLAAAEAEFTAILAEAYSRLGKIHTAQKTYAKAISDFEAAALHQPDSQEILVGLAIAYFDAGQYEKAFEPLGKALASNPHSADAHHMLGKTYFMRGEFGKALTELETTLKLSPKDFDVAYRLGLTYLKQRQLAPAQQLYTRMLRQLGARPQLHIIFGRAYRETGFLPEAIIEFKKAIALDPKFPRAHYYLGLTYLLKDGADKFSEAAEEFKIELAANPDEYLANYYLGIVNLLERKLDQAVSLLEKASRLQPDNPAPYFHLGQAYQALDKHLQAVEALKKSISLTSSRNNDDSQMGTAHYRLGQSLLKTGRTEEGEKELKIAAEMKAEGVKRDEMKTAAYLNSTTLTQQNSKLAETVSAAGIIAESKEPGIKATEELKSSENYYSKVVASAYNNIGLLRAERNDFRGAAEKFALAAEWNPQLEDIHFNWGLACYKAEMYQEAIPPLESELKVKPASLAVKQLLGTSYFMVDNFQKASEQLNDVIAVKTNDAGLYYMAAISFIKQGNREAGNKVIERMVTLHGSSPQLHILLGQAYDDQGETAKALDELKAALLLDKKTRLAHYYTGLIYLKMGKFDEATQEFEAELSTNPNDIQAKFQLGFVLLANQKTDRGIGLMREIIKLKPDYAQAHYELGKTLLEMGNIKEAVEWLETAAKLSPDEAHIHYQLGRAYLAAGRKAEGESHIEISSRLKAKARSQANP